MRNTLLSALAVFLITLLFAAAGCDKNRPAKPEDPLRISIDAIPFTITQATYYDFNLKVESEVPSAGVKIEYTVKGETVNMIYPQAPTINTYGNLTAIHLINLPRQVTCICDISVTSRGDSRNKTTTSFRVVYK